MSTWPSTGASSVIAMDSTCVTVDGPHPEARLIIQCEKNAVGRYLVIQIAAVKSTLTLCEVEVFLYQDTKCKYSSDLSGVLDMVAALLALLFFIFLVVYKVFWSRISNRSLLALTAVDETQLMCD